MKWDTAERIAEATAEIAASLGKLVEVMEKNAEGLDRIGFEIYLARDGDLEDAMAQEEAEKKAEEEAEAKAKPSLKIIPKPSPKAIDQSE